MNLKFKTEKLWSCAFFFKITILKPLPRLLSYAGVHQQLVNAESLLLEAVKQVKVSDLEDDILELPEDDPATASNQ